MKQHWLSVGQSVGPVLIGPAGKQTLYTGIYIYKDLLHRNQMEITYRVTNCSDYQFTSIVTLVF